MDHVKVESSNIASVAYDETSRVLEIEFTPRKDGTSAVYQYQNVQPDTWIRLLHAPSKGGYFSANIRGKYPATRIK